MQQCARCACAPYKQRRYRVVSRPFHYSTIPPFHHSTIPSFHSTVPRSIESRHPPNIAPFMPTLILKQNLFPIQLCICYYVHHIAMVWLASILYFVCNPCHGKQSGIEHHCTIHKGHVQIHQIKCQLALNKFAHTFRLLLSMPLSVGIASPSPLEGCIFH